MVAIHVGLGQARQQDGPQRHAQQRGRELHQPVGIGQPRDAAVLQARGDIGIDHQADLRGRHGKHRRSHFLQYLLHAGVAQAGQRVARDAWQHADLHQGRNLDRDLQQAAGEYRDRHRVNRLRQVRRKEQHADDEGQVQQYRRHRRNPEFAPGVEDAAGQRHERHEADVWKHHACHHHRGVKGIRVVAEAGGDQVYHHWRGGDAKQGDDQHRPDHRGGHVVGQFLGGGAALPALVFSQDRHERLRKGAFGKQPAQQVGNAEGDVEGVGVGGSAEGPGKQDLADQTGDARQHRHAGDGCQGFMQVHGAALYPLRCGPKPPPACARPAWVVCRRNCDARRLFLKNWEYDQKHRYFRGICCGL